MPSPLVEPNQPQQQQVHVPEQQVLQPIGLKNTLTPQFESALPMPHVLEPNQIFTQPTQPYMITDQMGMDSMQLQQDMNNVNVMQPMNSTMQVQDMQTMQDQSFQFYDFQCSSFNQNAQMNSQMNYMMPANAFQSALQMNNGFDEFECGGAMGWAPCPSTVMPMVPQVVMPQQSQPAPPPYVQVPQHAQAPRIQSQMPRSQPQKSTLNPSALPYCPLPGGLPPTSSTAVAATKRPSTPPLPAFPPPRPTDLTRTVPF